MANIGEKLKTLRRGRKLTQQQVADHFGISRGTISNYEIGRRKPTIRELQAFAAFYNVPLDFFGEVATKDELFDILSRAKMVFQSDDVPKSDKESLYRELMKLYLEIK